MQRLKHILTFEDLVVGVPALLPHTLNHRNGRALAPALVVLDGGGFEATADAQHVTVTRLEGGAARVQVYVEAWHTIEGGFPRRPQPLVVYGGGGTSASTVVFDGQSIIGTGTLADPVRVNSATTERTLLTTCHAGDLEGSCVGIVSEGVVTRLDPSTTGLVTPAMGVIRHKLTPTLCVVVLFGEVTVPPNLIPGRVCWVGADGLPTSTWPTPTPGQRLANQVIGVALSADRLLVDPERRPVIVTGDRPD